MKSDHPAQTNPRRALSAGELAACLSGLAAYGGAVGVLNMRAYWGAFKIDPFQFASVVDLAWVGLAAIGAALIACGVGMLLGLWAGEHLNRTSEVRRWVPWIVLAAFIVFVVAILIWLPASGWLVFGIVSTWALGFVLLKSPLTRSIVRDGDTFLAISIAFAFLPAMATFIGLNRAHNVLQADKGLFVSSANLPKNIQAKPLKFAGRLGDTYVLVQAVDKTVILQPASGLTVILRYRSETTRKDPDVAPHP